jgi:hypothetical protein
LRDGSARAEFTWEGIDDARVSGRGCSARGTTGGFVGHIFIHRGDHSGDFFNGLLSDRILDSALRMIDHALHMFLVHFVSFAERFGENNAYPQQKAGPTRRFRAREKSPSRTRPATSAPLVPDGAGGFGYHSARSRSVL